MNPAANLVGQTINGEWQVEEAINLAARGSTGGNFCLPYVARNIRNGERAFLKVLDVVGAILRYNSMGVGVAETLHRITSAHVFETQLLEDCRKGKFNRVVHALAYGELPLPVNPLGVIGFPFLIFELGDGDTHAFIDASKSLDHAWWMSTLHQTTIGMNQLHSIDAAHQDLKPSNVVFFGYNNAKLTDLGRAARRGHASLNDTRAGDNEYAPPEYYYKHVPTEWDERFLAYDLYLLGSLAFTGIASISMTTALFHTVSPAFHWLHFSDDYQDAMPALVKALADVLEQIRPAIPKEWADPFVTTVAQLCHPDPAKRGHPRNHLVAHGKRFSVERYISSFNRMAYLAKLPLKK